MTARTQQDRTPTNNTPPANNALLPGQLFVEMGTPLRLWTGVPTSIVASGNKVIFDTSQFVSSFNTRVGPVTLISADLTAAGGALLASPSLTGDPKAPTASPGDNDTSIATTAFTTAAVQVETSRATAAEALRAPIASPVFTGDPQAPTPAPGDADTSVATTAFVQAAVNAAASGSVHNIGRNLLHNPLFNVAQRGAGPFTAAGYTLDRWAITGGADTWSITQAATADAGKAGIGDEAATYAISNNFTGNAAAGAWHSLTQYIEDVRRLGNKTITVSFYAASSGTLKLGISIDQYFGTGGAPSAQVFGNGTAVTLSTTYARYSVTLPVPSVAGTTVGTANDHATVLRLWYSSGATNNTRSGGVGVQSGIINVWGVQLEIGSVATPLEKPDPRYDRSNCQRFYCTSQVVSAWYGTATGIIAATLSLPTTMRANPTITVSTNSNINVSGFAASSIGNGSVASFNGTATATGMAMINVVFTASADL